MHFIKVMFSVLCGLAGAALAVWPAVWLWHWAMAQLDSTGQFSGLFKVIATFVMFCSVGMVDLCIVIGIAAAFGFLAAYATGLFKL